MAWAPAPNRPLPTPFATSKATLGQQKVGLLDSREVAMGADLVTTMASGYLAYGSGKNGNRWSTFWWVVSGISLVKFLHDSSRPY
jgi:hypothetical protein